MITFNYTLNYENRKSLSIIIQEGKVSVKAPHNIPQATIEQFLQAKSSWIEKKLREYAVHMQTFIQVKQLEKILYCGQEFDLVIPSSKNRVENSVFYLKSEKHIQFFFSKHSFASIEKFLCQIAERMQVQYSSLKLVNFKAKWGSCDRQKNIKLNWRVSMLPEHIIYYLLVHELAHTVEFNHSANFWKVVERYCKDYKSLRKQLKKYDFLTNLYR